VRSLDEIYSAAWVSQDFTGLKSEFDIVADAITRQFRPQSVNDVGCGPGMILERLRFARGISVIGYEGSRHCIAFAHPQMRDVIQLADLRVLSTLPAASLTLCTEVAEHIEPEFASHLVALLCSAMSPIVFTAAPPGQDGNHHVNCREPGYWLDLFAMHGVAEDRLATAEIKNRWRGLKRLSHMTRNVMVLR
jgi:trans-aconitate methyltransferase